MPESGLELHILDSILEARVYRAAVLEVCYEQVVKEQLWRYPVFVFAQKSKRLSWVVGGSVVGIPLLVDSLIKLGKEMRE